MSVSLMTAPSLSSRDRILRAIARNPNIDRIPIIFRAESPLMKHLQEQLHLDSDLAVLKHFHADSLQIGPVFKPDAKQPPDQDGNFTDLFGNRYRTIKDGDLESYHCTQPILASAASPDDLARVRWPSASVLDIPACIQKAKAARDSGLAVYGGIWASVFTTSRNLMGEEDFLLATIENPDLVAAVIDRLTQSYLEMNQAYLSATRGLIDVYYFGSDLGTQRSMFISPEMCRRFIIPSLAHLAQQARIFNLPVMYHTCGAVSSIIDDLIAAGIDALDPVQVSAAGMSPGQLARFKNRIAFHGAISTQTTLPNDSPEQIQHTVHQTLRTLGPTGLIAGPDQDMIGQIPLQNIQAMCSAIRNFTIP
ncbi:MAG: hypothetical protein FWD61_13990 [Phycisphaerales bacterium]|nr:hypothetical protein [Phycisphaerales bacterium]